MSRQFLTLVLVVLVLACSPASTSADDPVAAPDQPHATIYVNSITGNDSANCLTPATACKTLAGAIARATANDTIQLAAGVYPTYNTQVDKQLTITGAGQAATILDGGGVARVLFVGADATLSDLTIRNGRIVTTTGAIFETGGGGIVANAALSLRNVTLTANGVSGSGGAIFHRGDLAIENSQILSNTADGSAGAIYSYNSGSLTITNTLLAGNQSDGEAGAIAVYRPTVLTDVTLAANSAGSFGGALNVFGPVTLNRVTVHRNTANAGAAIFAQLGAITMTNVTVSGNVAGNNYGGIGISGAVPLVIRSSTIAGNSRTNTAGNGFNGILNSGGTVNIHNTIIANNAGRNCGGVDANWTSAGYNLASDATCGFTQGSDLQGSDPLLAPLADNGGPTLTHALLPGSPAIDAGDNAQCPATDQRGIARPVDGDGGGATCDRGAFETRGQIVIADRTVTEGDAGAANAVFTVTLTPAATTAVSVTYTTVASTAAAGSDFTPAAGVLVWDVGQTTKTIAVPVLGDTADEADEAFTVQLSSPFHAELADGAGAGLILDDDGASALTIDDRELLEGNSGLTDLVFTVSLSPASAQAVAVNFATVSGSALAGSDFDATSGVLTFSPGQTTQTVTVRVRGDTLDEGAGEAFSVALTNAQGAAIFDGSGSGLITDDDVATLRLASTGSAVTEGNSGVTPLVFTVTLSLPASFTITVDYATGAAVGAGHATPGIDFATAGGTLTFAPGELLKTVAVNVVGDTNPEPDEDLHLTITNGAVAIAGSQETGYIRNDDLLPVYLPLVAGGR